MKLGIFFQVNFTLSRINLSAWNWVQDFLCVVAGELLLSSLTMYHWGITISQPPACPLLYIQLLFRYLIFLMMCLFEILPWKSFYLKEQCKEHDPFLICVSVSVFIFVYLRLIRATPPFSGYESLQYQLSYLDVHGRQTYVYNAYNLVREHASDIQVTGYTIHYSHSYYLYEFRLNIIILFLICYLSRYLLLFSLLPALSY